MRTPSIKLVLLIGVAVLFEHAKAHLALVAMMGETNGLTGKGYGILDGTPRDGTARDPFQLDTAVIREGDIMNGIASPCGRTLIGGPIDMDKALEKAEDGGLPDVGKEGMIRLVAHQVNADGGGPYSCAVDYTASGNNFEPVDMEVNLPGQNGRSDARSIDLPIVAKMPPGATCTGGADGQTCLVRCLNGAKAGPFGGCMAFTQKQGLYNDPAPTGKGPSAGAYIDPITQNPVTRFGDVFQDESAKLAAKAQDGTVTVTPIPDKIQTQNEGQNDGNNGQAQAKGKAKKRSYMRRAPLVRRQQNNGKTATNGNKGNNGSNGSNNLGNLNTMPPESRVGPPANAQKTPASTSFGTVNGGSNGGGNNAGKFRSFKCSDWLKVFAIPIEVSRVAVTGNTNGNNNNNGSNNKNNGNSAATTNRAVTGNVHVLSIINIFLSFSDFRDGSRVSILKFSTDPISKVGHVDSIKPTKEGIAFEIATGPLGQADVPQNVRTGNGKKRSLSTRDLTTRQAQAQANGASKQGGGGNNPTNPKGLSKEDILKAEMAEANEDRPAPQGKAKAKLRSRATAYALPRSLSSTRAVHFRRF
ncbi:hypothetical protein CROQUDRAFT_42082 [Cronartium quercuum f. sp. fusiforme G11]|uniref:Uncharacterized protein n=1 Tax=Cronartium quercuum f. sp. fusiforme G11 TaxID=708437 RepID=A0A9P6NR17_9BASI|nr:hypothetical protein CROQUDRAFT_42082 [Cronartium quercuum f. sp. fusiforme G11]